MFVARCMCELHWFDTAPEHIHQPPMTLADEELMKARRFAWVKEGVPEGGDPLGPENNRLCLFLFMQDLSRTQVREMVEVAKAGTDADALEYAVRPNAKVALRWDGKITVGVIATVLTLVPEWLNRYWCINSVAEGHYG